MNKKYILMLGAPGSGKGTQSNFISKKYNLPEISTGKILRDYVNKNDNHLANEIRSTMNEGKLVSNDQIIAIVKERIKENDCQNGFILDGFPRNLEQAQALDTQIKLNIIINLTIDFEKIVTRITGRRHHNTSGRTYHIQFNPPKTEGIDDITGEALIQREDDQEEVVRKRLEIFTEQTKPLLTYYQAKMEQTDGIFLDIEASQPIDKITEQIFNKIN